MKNQTRLSVAASMAVVALLGGAIFGGTAADAKKKGGKKSKPVTVQNTTPTPIPDATGSPGPPPVTTLFGKLDTPLTVSKKKVKKNVVTNVAFTIQTTGLAANAASDLDIDIISPEGVVVGANSNSGGGGFAQGQSIGPLTLQPNSNVKTCNYDPATQVPPPPPCADPVATLNPPYVGTAGDTGLKLFNGSKAAGTWHVVVEDQGFAVAPAPALTSIQNSVKLVISTLPQFTG